MALNILGFETGHTAAPAAIAHQRVKDGALLLDVRTPEEFAEQHLPGAVNIPVQELGRRQAELGSAQRQVVVYCRSGGRSAQAAGILRAAGHDVLDIGPMHAWFG